MALRLVETAAVVNSRRKNYIVEVKVADHHSYVESDDACEPAVVGIM